MVYYTGDIHGDPTRLEVFCQRWKLKEDDIIVLLGDVCANNYMSKRDEETKQRLNALGPTVFCIHGNHEIRPHHFPTYETKQWNDGVVFYEEQYPNLLFAKDGEIFTMDGLAHLVIGGAYSVDKHYRIARGYGWWEDEQPSEEIKAYVEEQIQNHQVDVILSHTCPYTYIPREAFLPMVNQDEVDDSTERWLDRIEESVDYRAWLCGHWHINKRIDWLWLLFNNAIDSDEILERGRKNECKRDAAQLQ